MNTVTKIGFAIGIASAASFYPTGANAWWNDDDYHDRWYGGPWYGGYPGYGWGGYPGYWGHPGYGWGGYPGYNQSRTIILYPQISVTPREQKPETKPPQYGRRFLLAVTGRLARSCWRSRVTNASVTLPPGAERQCASIIKD